MATMPQLNISFKSAGTTALTRGERGVILLVLRQATIPTGNPITVHYDTDIPATATAANKKYINMALLGNETAPRKVICFFIGNDAALDATGGVFEWAQLNHADYFVMPTVETDELTSDVKDWIIAQKASHNMIKAVLPNTAANSEWIINYTTEGVKVGTDTFTAEQFAPRIAGIICGTALSHSVTYVAVPEATDCTRLTSAQMDAAVSAGQLFCFFDGEKVKLSRGVNSLTTTTTDKGAAFQKIKHVEVMNLIETDLRRLCQDYYIGKYPNSYDSRCLLLSAIESYLEGYVMDGMLSMADVAFDLKAIKSAMTAVGIDAGDMSDDEILQNDFGTGAYYAISLRLLDAIEDITINLTV
ncbi:MAG: phage tail sheath subtilisin-like domain-containing protein [Clostridia bacterium]|nr:phage tail sheath subtilisin-like domain-containing protein [Clostridia bacterium]